MTALYVPATEETDQKKQNQSLQLIGGVVSTNTTNIATNTANIAANTAAIAALGAVNKGYFKAHRTTNQTGASTGAFNKLQMNTEVVDSQGWYDVTTNFRYQPTESGYYLCVSACQTAAGAADTTQAAIYKNGVIETQALYIASALVLFSSCTSLVFLNGSTDYVEAYGWAPNPVTVFAGGADRMYFFGWKVGA